MICSESGVIQSNDRHREVTSEKTTLQRQKKVGEGRMTRNYSAGSSCVREKGETRRDRYSRSGRARTSK